MARIYDLLIIGAGTAGLSAAQEAKKHTDNYAIIESGPCGTTCARVGCMPSKTLIEAANTYHTRAKFPEYGIGGAGDLAVDVPALLKHVRDLRDHFVDAVVEGMKDHPVIKGEATITGPQHVEVKGTTYQAKKILITTGSVPFIPEIFQPYEVRVWTSDTIFEEESLPKSLAVIGLGNTGLELGQALSRLGMDMTGFEPTASLAGITDPEINDTVLRLMRNEMTIMMETEITEVEQIANGYRLSDGQQTYEVEGLLIAAGRKPQLKDLGIEKAGITLENDVPEYDPHTMQIMESDFYIAGDVNIDRAVKHEAVDEGRIAAQHALGVTVSSRRTPFAITFTDPPVVQVGARFEELSELSPIIGEVSYQDQGRAMMAQENQGKARLYASHYGTLLGAEMAAPDADHLGHILALAVQEEVDIQQLLHMPYYHPVLEEGLRTALKRMSKEQQEAA